MDDRLFYTIEKTPEEEQAELTKMAQHLIVFGLPAHLFNRTAAYNEGYTYKMLYKMLKTMAHYKHSGHLEGIIALSCQKGFYNSHTNMTLDQFSELVKFINTKEGQNEVQKVQRQAKLAKKAGNMLTAKDLALVKIFDIQKRAKKEEVSAFEKKIEHCHGQIRELEKNWEKKEEEIDEEFEKKVSDSYTVNAESKGVVVNFGPQLKRPKKE